MQQPQLRGRDVGHDAHDDVDARLQAGGHGVEEVAAMGLDAVGARARHGALVDVAADDAGVRAALHEDPRHRAAPGAQVDRGAAGGQALGGAPRELLALPPRDVDARIDPDLQAAERRGPGDPGQRLAREATRHEGVEQRAVVARARQELGRLLLRGDEARVGQPFSEVHGD